MHSYRATNDSMEITKVALNVLRKLYKGFNYKRAGVIVGILCRLLKTIEFLHQQDV